MTQDQLAAGSGIDSSNIRAYENGRNMPNLYSLMRLAQALSVEPGELLVGLTLEMFERDDGALKNNIALTNNVSSRGNVALKNNVA
jgi:transcriptional regulator with XRE-family HTH domain